MDTVTSKGNRKATATRTGQLVVLAGFLIACWLKAQPELFFAFVVGVTGNVGAFMWGNSKEHEAAFKPTVETKG